MEPIKAMLPEAMLDAACPTTWAWENLRPAGQGEHASLFFHPDDPEVVIRVSDYPDGWFSYASRTAEELAWIETGTALDPLEVLPNAPRGWDIHHKEGVWMAVAEKLSPIQDDDHEAIAWCQTAAALLTGNPVDPEALRQFELAQPDFGELETVLTDSCTDFLRLSNWLLRQRTLVLNDPQATMTCFEADLLVERLERLVSEEEGGPQLTFG